ncbi:MAG: response regulator [Saprospiraceae bacterium]
MAATFHLIKLGKYSVLSLLVLLNLLPLSAQEYIAKVQHYGVEQGLSHRQVNAIFQDSRGFVWIGTPNGLNRFDGYNFRQYTKEKNGLYFNYIQEISEDADGWLWLVEQEQKSICLFHPDRGEVLSFEEKFGKTDSLFARRRFEYKILNDENGAIWLPSDGGETLFRYHPASGIQAIPIDGALGKMHPICFSDRKTLWVSSENPRAILEFDLKGKVLQRYDNAWLNGDWALSDDCMLLFTRKPGGVKPLVLFDLNGGVLPYQPVIGEPSPYPALIFPFDNKGKFVVHDRLVDAQGHTLAQWEFAQHDRSNFMWRGYLVDRAGRYWLGDDFGFYILQIKPNRFSHLFYQKSAKPGLGNSIRGIVATHEKVYANLENSGLFEHDQRRGQNRCLVAIPNGSGNFALALSKNGELLSGTRNAFFRLKPDGTVIEKIQTDFDVWAFCEDDSGTLWLGSSTNGLHKLSPGASTPIPFVRYNGFDALASAFILHIEQVAAGLLWVCASNGFYKVHPQKGVLARYWPGGTGEYFLPAENFLHFHLDADGVFWLATSTGLLRVASVPDSDGSRRLRWDEHTGKWFNRSNKLSNEFIYAVYEDKTGRLWLPTDHGIICLNKKTEAVKTYFVSDGLSDPEFNRKAHFQASDGTLYFGGLNGINVFNPADFPEVTDTLAGIPLVLTAFHQFDGKQNRLSDRTYELLQTTEIRLRPDDRFFNIELALLSFDEPQLIQYAWKIDGLDKDWHYQKERQINFGGLPYGVYTLRIKAQAPNGQGSEKELTFTVRVLRPWYLQTWFLALVAFLLSLGIRGYIHWRNRQHIQEQKKLEGMVEKATERIELDKRTIEKQAEALRQLDKVKSNFFANVSHELRTPLTLMLGPISSMLKSGQLNNRNFTYAKLAQQNGSQLLNLVGEILDLQKLESGKLELHPKPILLYPFLKRIAAQFESLAQNKSIAFVFLYRAEKRLQIEVDTAKLELVLNNLLSNAMKFTGTGGRVEFKAEDLAHSIRFTVTDSGKGIHPDDLPHIFDRFFQSQQADAPREGGTGIGLALVRELSVLFNGSVEAQSPVADGNGTAFTFEFPKTEVMGAATSAADENPEPVHDAFVPIVETASDDLGKPTVLLVEDNRDLQMYVQTLLSDKYRVVVAENGQQALEWLANGAVPAIIISDIMMPLMDGFQLLERLKSADQYRHIPVVMLTARADMQDKLRALRIGVDDYLLKPFEEEELLTRVENLLLRQQNRYSQNPDEKDKTAAVPCISEADSEWLSELEIWAQANLQNEFLSVSTMAHQVSMSERQLLRRLRELTGLSPQQYIAEIRLQKARDLLERGAVRSVAEAAYAAGFGHPKVFSRTYRARFGRLPSTYF